MDYRKLDLLVAKEIMGLDIVEMDGPPRKVVMGVAMGAKIADVPNYSTDIKLAFDVALKSGVIIVSGMSAKDICLAALKAKAIDVSEWEKS